MPYTQLWFSLVFLEINLDIQLIKLLLPISILQLFNKPTTIIAFLNYKQIALSNNFYTAIGAKSFLFPTKK